MKNWSLRFIVLTVAFFAGISIVALWLINPADFSVENAPKTLECYPQYSENFKVSDYKGVFTRRVYPVGKEENNNINSDENINAEITANLFSRFREIPLTKLPMCVEEIYRLTWIPTFHAPTVIRIWRSGNEHFITTKRLGGKGGYGLGEIEIEQTHSLTTQEWQILKDLIHQSSYWKMSSTIEEAIPNDGANWTFEGLNDGQYHSVFRITPSKELAQIFKQMFKLSGVKNEYELYLS